MICIRRGILWGQHRWGPQYDCWILNTLAMNQTGTIWEGLEYFGCLGHVLTGVLDFLPDRYWSLSFSTTPLKELFKDPCLRSRRQTSVSERALICSTNQVWLLFKGLTVILYCQPKERSSRRSFAEENEREAAWYPHVCTHMPEVFVVMSPHRTSLATRCCTWLSFQSPSVCLCRWPNTVSAVSADSWISLGQSACWQASTEELQDLGLAIVFILPVTSVWDNSDAWTFILLSSSFLEGWVEGHMQKWISSSTAEEFKKKKRIQVSLTE